MGQAFDLRQRPEGFSETLYAYVSKGNNNGSAFAGYTGYLQPNGTNHGAYGISFANLLGGTAMLGARFLPLSPRWRRRVARRQARLASRPGTLAPTRTFVVVLISVI